MNKFKSNKGITLIALAITIVVLVVLAGVSIQIATKEDQALIDEAKEAKTLAEESGEKTNDILDEYREGSKEDVQVEEYEDGRVSATALQIGEYVNYPVYYENVASSYSDAYIPSSEYNGWRVLSIEGTGTDAYVRLIPAGIPLSYYHNTDWEKTIENFTTGFFSAPFDSTTSNGTEHYYQCGFKTEKNGTLITDMASLKNIFLNDYTQTENSLPKIESLTLDELKEIGGETATYFETLNSLYDNLFTIPCEGGNDYTVYFLASVSSNELVDMVNATHGVYSDIGVLAGVRPIVSLKSDVRFSKDSTGAWDISL